jgi:predicted nuclease of predicted toxin-antitoxin system
VRFLGDESCDFAVVRALRSHGHEVETVAELAPGAPDEEVVALAVRTRAILLTEDRDFGRLVFAQETSSGGVIYIRFPASARGDLGGAVVHLVDRMGERLVGKFVVLQPGRARVTSV